MPKIEGKMITMKIEMEDVERMEKIMRRHKLTQAQAIRNLLSLGIDCYEDLECLGIPQTVALFDGLKGKLRSPESPSVGSKDLIKST